MSSSNYTKSIISNTFSSSSSIFSPFSLTKNWKYHVFISFRGEDTRKTFTDHLHYNLCRQGIKTFKDDTELTRGKTISKELVKAIHDSKFLIIVFSKNFASSSWCLDEVVNIYECLMRDDGHVVYPIFYDVEPSEVKKQTGRFGFEFQEYERKFGVERVEKWKDALRSVAALSGWHVQNRHESEVINDIVKEVARKARASSFRCRYSARNFVGMESRLETIRSYLDLERHKEDVRLIGICGMGGIGKTTLARVIFDELSSQFEEDGSCFLADVREVHEKHGLIGLQERFLSKILKEKYVNVDDCYAGMDEIRNRLCLKRVLVVLDDVDKLIQLETLVGNRDWFGEGSRIIITTRNEHLLRCHGVDVIHRVEGLDHSEAFELFCSKAFRHGDCYPDEKFLELANHFLNHANGLPLALDVLGSSLLGRSPDEWKSALDKLQEIPNEKILRKLQISFDGLEEVEKKIFLDIACFFKGEDKNHVMKVLRSCGFYPEIGIRELVDKSLVTILDNNRIWMHDLVQEMGRQIVRRESQEPGERSRLWCYQDVSDVLSHYRGTSQVEGIVLDYCHNEDGSLSAKAFTQMTKLRVLKLQNLQFSDGIQYLSNELRYMEWYGYPFKSLPSTFQPDKLVELHMRCSNLEQFRKGMKPLRVLKVIDLSHSKNLLKTPDFREVPNLENLNLEGCIRLQEIDHSIGVLKRLMSMSLKDCRSLVMIPDDICNLKSLKTLILNGCSKLNRLPDKLQEISSLEKLDFGGITRKQQKSITPFDFLFKLPFLLKKNWDPLAFMLPNLSALRSLQSLNLSDCHLKDGVFPEDLSCFPLLQSLNLSGNDFVSLPSSIQGMSKLEDFRLDNCKKLQSLPDLPSTILFLCVEGCNSWVNLVPMSIHRQYKFGDIRISGCKRLQMLPENLPSYLHLSVDGCASVQTSTNSVNSSSKSRSVKVATRVNLIEIEGQDKMEFSRFESYSHFLVKHVSTELGHFDSSTQLTMCFPAKSIPGFFKYHGVGSSLIISLPSYWYISKWIGFKICALIQADNQPSVEPVTVSFDLHACNEDQSQQVLLGHSKTDMSNDTTTTTDQLLSFYVPGSSKKLASWVDPFSHLKVSFYSDKLKVKCCGIRLLYHQDVDDLIQCNSGFENSDPGDHNTKRDRDEFLGHSQVGSNEVTEFSTDESQTKRMRTSK